VPACPLTNPLHPLHPLHPSCGTPAGQRVAPLVCGPRNRNCSATAPSAGSKARHENNPTNRSICTLIAVLNAYLDLTIVHSHAMLLHKAAELLGQLPTRATLAVETPETFRTEVVGLSHSTSPEAGARFHRPRGRVASMPPGSEQRVWRSRLALRHPLHQAVT
jgi:hypothetical protein